MQKVPSSISVRISGLSCNSNVNIPAVSMSRSKRPHNAGYASQSNIDPHGVEAVLERQVSHTTCILREAKHHRVSSSSWFLILVLACRWLDPGGVLRVGTWVTSQSRHPESQTMQRLPGPPALLSQHCSGKSFRNPSDQRLHRSCVGSLSTYLSSCCSSFQNIPQNVQ